MGLDQRVTFPSGTVPSWPTIAERLVQRNCSVQLRMIDGQLALPDEKPLDAWKELRLGTPAGMITLRREENAIAVVIWGSADEALRQTWSDVIAAIAQATGGKIERNQIP